MGRIRGPLIFSLIALLVIALGSFLLVRLWSQDPVERTQSVISAYIRRSLIVEREVRRADRRIRYNELQLRRLQAQASRLSRPSDASRLTGKVDGLEESLKQLEDDQSRLEAALLDTPAKALQLPLLARGSRERQESQRSSPTGDTRRDRSPEPTHAVGYRNLRSWHCRSARCISYSRTQRVPGRQIASRTLFHQSYWSWRLPTVRHPIPAAKKRPKAARPDGTGFPSVRAGPQSAGKRRTTAGHEWSLSVHRNHR